MDYRAMSGTSMAAPHVAGLAALIRGADRGLGPDQVEQVIEETAADLGEPGRDDDFGHGRADAAAALAAVAKPAVPSEPAQPDPTQPDPALPEPTQPDPAQPTPAQPEPATPAQPTTPSPATSSPAMSSPATPSPATPSPATPGDPADSPTGAPKPTPRTWVAYTSPTQLTIVIDGLDGQIVEVQQSSGTDWVTVLRYPAVRIVRLDGLITGLSYRIVVPATERFEATVSSPVQM
jgi:hypothetical protein